MPNLKNFSFGKSFQVWSSELVHRVLRELFRLLDSFPNRSFCRSDISRIQVKSNWSIGKRLVASDSKKVWKTKLILLKSLLIFFNGWFRNSFISKELALKESLQMSCCTRRTAQALRWSCEPIILSIGHFESPTEVQLNSWWKTVSLWSITVWYFRLTLLKGHWKFLQCLILNFNTFQKNFCEGVLR